ncbi:hypothetical protein BOX15_Mlig024376g3, partial [Macrostomum lignano]
KVSQTKGLSMDVKLRAQSLIEFGLPRNWIALVVERFAQGGITSLTSNELYMIVKRVCNILRTEASVIDVRGDCRVVGNLHGSIESLQAIFRTYGWPSDVCYVFLGDYLATIDDKIQTNVFVLLLIFKVVYPKHILLLRGASECEHCAADMGLLDLLTTSFTASLYREFKSVFKYLPLAARANGVHLMCNASLSLKRGNLLDLEQVVRPCTICHRDGIMRLLARQPSRLGDHTLQADPLEDFDEGETEDVCEAISFMKRSNMKICVRNEGIEQSLAGGYNVEGRQCNVISIASASNIRGQPCQGVVLAVHRNCASTLHPTDPKAAKPDVRLIMYCPNK